MGQLQTVPVGKPVANIQIYILNPALQPVPIGVCGEIYIAGDGVGRGYLNRPNLTAAKFITNPFAVLLQQNIASSHWPIACDRLYRTGDRGRYLADGTIEYLGRLDHQVKMRGFRVELGEIEATLLQHPDVTQTVVTLLSDQHEPSDRSHLVAYVVTPMTAPDGVTQLRTFLQKRLPEWMVPSYFVPLATLPLTPNGKIDRRALPAPTRQNTSAQPQIPPRNDLEQQLAQIWVEVLQIKAIGIEDNFFELGGHSLLAIRLMTRIQKQFQQDLPLALLFQAPTIAQLASHLTTSPSSSPTNPPAALVCLKAGSTSRPPLFCLHPGGGHVFCYHPLAQQLETPDRAVYGLQAPGLAGEPPPAQSLPALANRYIQAIQTVQRHGPYHLAGWCLGGTIAFEMARQLQAAGETVAALILIDSEAPQVEATTEAQLLTRLMQEILVYADPANADPVAVATRSASITALLSDFANLDTSAQLQHALALAQSQNLLPPEVQLPQAQTLWQVYKHNVQASAAYQPQPFAGSALLLWARAGLPEAMVKNRAWLALIQGDVQIRILEGDHYTILQPPYVAALGQLVDTYSGV
ncbi:MAG: alpha/beta fold hydrolase [Cyanobacteria bacterium P01_F01_bin.4]